MSFTSDATTKSAFPMFKMMMDMQRLGLQAMSVYQPLASAFLTPATSWAERGAGTSTFAATGGRTAEVGGSHGRNEEQVIGIGEEVLNVGTRMVPGKTTRVRRVVVQNPVQQDVTLHTETVVLERRKPISTSGNDVLTEVTVEMSDFNEVPVVSKSVHLIEEVLLRTETTARTETIRDTVRRDKLEIDQPSNLPAVLNQSMRPTEHKPETAEVQEKKQAFAMAQARNKAGDQKNS